VRYGIFQQSKKSNFIGLKSYRLYRTNSIYMPSFLNINFPGKLFFANGCLDKLPNEIVQLHPSNVLFITIEPLLGTLEPIIAKLNGHGIYTSVDTSIVAEPSFSDFRKLMKNISPSNPDVVVGIGGGSVLDIAKLVAAQLDNAQDLNEYVGIGLLKGRKKKLICVPATSGTGSEVSPNAILVDDSDNQKRESSVHSFCRIWFLWIHC